MIFPQEHEYSVHGGRNRTYVGRWLFAVAVGVSGWLVILGLSVVDLAKMYGWNVNTPPAFASLGTGSLLFYALYWVLNKYAWRWKWVSIWLKVPNLAGTWDCQGKKLKADGSVEVTWSGTVKIKQKWDKLHISLETGRSRSESLAAALTRDPAGGFVLLYQYDNTPRGRERELAAHMGCAVLWISEDRRSATADYFNGRGRMSTGEMVWTKQVQ